MSISDWWVETISGKVDPNPIYGGLLLSDRRNPRKRDAYIARRLTEGKADMAAHASSPQFPQPNLAVLKTTIYESSYILSGAHSAEQERSVITEAFRAILNKDANAEADWTAVVARLKGEPGLGVYFPSLFAGDINVFFGDFRNAELVRKEREASEARAEEARKEMVRKRKAEEEAKQLQAKRDERARIQATISTMQAELARLNSMFHASSGGEFMDRARLVIAIEAREDGIRQLQQMLRS